MTGLKRWTPELLTNYTPAFKPFPPPDIETACDTPVVCMAFSEAYIPYLIGLLEIYAWDDRFIGTDEERQHGVDMFSELRTIFMTAQNCCCQNGGLSITILTRITVDGRIEVSTDGGDSYTDFPQAPYITTPSYPPYMTSHDGTNKCDVADNIYQETLVTVEKFIANYGTLTALKDVLAFAVELLAGAVAVLLDLPETVVALVPTVIEWVKNAFTLSPEALEALFTEEFWSAYRCMVYCHTPDDGTYEHTDLTAMLGACNSLPGGAGFATAGEVVRGFLKFWQESGLNTIASLGHSTGSDCSDCDCSEPCEDLGNWVASLPGTLGTIIDRDEHSITVQSEYYSGYGQYVAYIEAGASGAPSTNCCRLIKVQQDGVDVPTATQASPCGNAYGNEAGFLVGIGTLEQYVNTVYLLTGGATHEVKFIFGA